MTPNQESPQGSTQNKLNLRTVRRVGVALLAAGTIAPTAATADSAAGHEGGVVAPVTSHHKHVAPTKHNHATPPETAGSNPADSGGTAAPITPEPNGGTAAPDTPSVGGTVANPTEAPANPTGGAEAPEPVQASDGGVVAPS
jgi:hypothetical protein